MVYTFQNRISRTCTSKLERITGEQLKEIKLSTNIKIVDVDWSILADAEVKRHERYKRKTYLTDYYHVPFGRFVITDINYQRKQYKITPVYSTSEGYINSPSLLSPYSYWVGMDQISKNRIKLIESGSVTTFRSRIK